MPASVCVVAIEVPSVVVGICVLGMIAWNALRWNFVLQCEGILLQLKVCTSAAVLLGHGPYPPNAVSLCSSHQTRPRMPASACLAALLIEVPAFVVPGRHLCVGNDLMECSLVEFVLQGKGYCCSFEPVRICISRSCMTWARPLPPTLSRCALTRRGPECLPPSFQQR